MSKEYQVVYLDETKKLMFIEGLKPIAETDDLSEAMDIMSMIWVSEKSEVAVWQPRTHGFRDYRKHQQLPNRSTNGRFAKII